MSAGALAKPVSGKRPRISRKVRFFISQLSAHIALILLSFLFALPFIWMVSTSLKPNGQLFKLPPQWIPNPFAWSNYPNALTFAPFPLYLRNSLFIALSNVVLTMISCTLVAYGFARIKWPGRDTLFIILIATMIIPYPVVMIPTFLIFRWLGWVGSFSPLIWPALTGNAFYIFLLRQFYMTIPMELSASAKIDGASEFQIYRLLILPLARPALAAVALFCFMANWNDFLGPLIYLSDNRYTLALGLYAFLGRVSSEWGYLMAATTMMVAPVLLLFFFAQRTFIQGITLTGIKG